MHGPCPAGHWTTSLAPADFGSLTVGRRYRVARAFTDYNGGVHEVGET